jgi:GT2 family glycosyltransferase
VAEADVLITFGAFILTFRRPDDLRRSVDFLLKQTRRPDQVWIIDNANDPEARVVAESYQAAGVRYHANSENLGSAGGVATGFELLAQAGCDWILSIDDDDAPRFPESYVTVERLIELIERNDDGRLGIVGVNGSRFDWHTGEHVRVPDGDLRGDIDVEIVGGGSCLTVSRALIEKMGAPNKDFFFGHYDPLYCLEAGRRGYRVMVNGELMLLYRTATDRLGIQPVRRTAVSTNPYHSLWRRYYVTRNYIYAMRKTFDEPRLARRMATRAMVKSVLAFGRGFGYGRRYSTMQVRGIIDGYRGRLGPTIKPIAKPTASGPAPVGETTARR